MNPLFERLTLITGSPAAEALEKSRVLIFGLGGVGSWCAEALVRSGIGSIYIVDSDRVSASNVNRQVQATSQSIGRYKTEALEERLREINPSCEVKAFPQIFSKEKAELFDFPGADYVIDAIDTLSHKLDLIEIAASVNEGKRFFSSMGMAQKLDPTQIRTVDIWKTTGCSLARLVRQGLKKRNFSGNFTTIYSPEKLPRLYGDWISHNPLPPTSCFLPPTPPSSWDSGKKVINGSAVCVTAAAGMVLASLVLRDIYARFTITETKT